MSALSNILEDQLADARRRAGTKIVRRLKNGLRIEITHIYNTVMLCLTRDQTYPSLQEWETVLRHFPYRTPKTEPQRLQQGSRFTIYAELPTQREAQTKFF